MIAYMKPLGSLLCGTLLTLSRTAGGGSMRRWFPLAILVPRQLVCAPWHART
jgi:hypothetical protein